ncbi:MAG: hypothetical protein ACLUKK_03525 [Lacrimispora saccharolytica]
MRRREEGILTVMPFTLLLFGILYGFSLEAAFLLLCSLNYFRDYFYPLLEFFVQSEEADGRKDKRADKKRMKALER